MCTISREKDGDKFVYIVYIDGSVGVYMLI